MDYGKIVNNDCLYAATAAAARAFRDNLRSVSGRDARDYLRTRGINGLTQEEFGLGYSQNRWDGLTAVMRGDYDEECMIGAGLAGVNRYGALYDVFRDRIMIPVKDARERIVGFSGRVFRDTGTADGVDGYETPKYMNTRGTEIFKKGETLYGLDLATERCRKSRCIWLVEGYFDVISLHMSNPTVAVAGVMGTALTQAQANILTAKADRVEILMDGDDAGRNAALKATVALINAHAWEVRISVLPYNEDPDSFIRKNGFEAISNLHSASLDLPQILFKFATQLFGDTVSFAQRGKIFSYALEYINQIENDITAIEHLWNFAQLVVGKPLENYQRTEYADWLLKQRETIHRSVRSVPAPHRTEPETQYVPDSVLCEKSQRETVVEDADPDVFSPELLREVYLRHAENIAPGTDPGSPDVKELVAFRMRVTGHNRESVEMALGSCDDDGTSVRNRKIVDSTFSFEKTRLCIKAAFKKIKWLEIEKGKNR
jgi:DNA primase catalytic core